MNIQLINDDCLLYFRNIEENTISLTVTSPPYDNLRNYCGKTTQFDFENIAKELYRITIKGGMVIWIVADATIKGSETGTSFKQALYFKSIGFNIHDTMIYRKLCYTPLTHRRYEQEFEYIFCFSKGAPITFNPLKTACKYAGQSTFSNPSFYKKNDGLLVSSGKRFITKDTKIKGNIFEYRPGSLTKDKKNTHPAIFPLHLAQDMIHSWSNPGDIVLDPFMGSGTTAIAALNLKRNFIGIEKEEKYYEMAKMLIGNQTMI
jgi:DNA modification methylase